MDRMPVCGIGDPGSIPGESTNKEPLWGLFVLVFSPDAVFRRNALRESKPD